jgi:hypothetical protein
VLRTQTSSSACELQLWASGARTIDFEPHDRAQKVGSAGGIWFIAERDDVHQASSAYCTACVYSFTLTLEYVLCAAPLKKTRVGCLSVAVGHVDGLPRGGWRPAIAIRFKFG